MPFTDTIGAATINGLAYVGSLARLSGGAARAVFVAPFQGKKFHFSRAVHQAMSVGVEALPITSLISFFVGTILALNAAYELRKFGALNLVASAVAVSMTRELGPLMTAIVVIGRSGSAFAAEIGTMKVNEEIDAMETMALEPVQFLGGSEIFGDDTDGPVPYLLGRFHGRAGRRLVRSLNRRLHLGHLYSSHPRCAEKHRHNQWLDQGPDVRSCDYGGRLPGRLFDRPRLGASGQIHNFGGSEIDFHGCDRRPDFHHNFLYYGAALIHVSTTHSKNRYIVNVYRCRHFRTQPAREVRRS